jgi:hypothetical protein
MESTSPESVLYIAIGVIAVVAITMLVLQGWLMKIAVRICGGDDIGIFYGLSVLTLAGLGGGVVSVGTAITMPETPPLLVLVVSFSATIGVMCLMLRMGPIRAFGVYLVQGFFSFIAAIVILAVGYGLVSTTVPKATIEQLAASAETKLSNIRYVSMAGVDQSESPPELQNLDDLTRILNGESGNLAIPLSFGPAAVESAAPQTTKSPQQPAEPLQSPYDNKIRTNPFAK